MKKLSKTLLKELIDDIKDKQEKDPHLGLDELRAAVFEDQITDRVAEHIKRCSLCNVSISKEQTYNPIYLLMKEYEAKGILKEEFWEMMDKVLEGIYNGDKT